jgi:hypothetical protein
MTETSYEKGLPENSPTFAKVMPTFATLGKIRMFGQFFHNGVQSHMA